MATGNLPAASAQTKHDIQQFRGSDDEITKLSSLWKDIFPEWPVEHERFAKMLRHKTGQHFIHENGFCLSFVADKVNGKIACIGVLEGHRGKGIGTALITKATEELRNTVQAAGEGSLKTLQMGSAFPRLWPEVPNTFSPEAKEFFVHRGMLILQPQILRTNLTIHLQASAERDRPIRRPETYTATSQRMLPLPLFSRKSQSCP